MRSEDLRFQVLRHLEQEPDMTQRELAAALGISLAGATARNLWLAQLRHSGAGRTKSSGTILNSFSWPDRAHATDGVRNPFLLRNSRNKRAYLHKLTPQGLTEKAALFTAQGAGAPGERWPRAAERRAGLS